ncbi:MAG: hypothetical protein JWN40_536 [Phycisphaerales bacterium]|nr:hypothetical protein [Phycisphaerales bacterium]
MRYPTLIALFCLSSAVAAQAPDQAAPKPAAADGKAPPAYHIYRGNTHAHTSFTWSHGEQWVNAKPDAGEKKSPLIYVDADGAQFPAKTQVAKPDWQKVQGPPAVHFALAKKSGYDFYITTDHSQESAFQPPSPTNASWVATLKAATDATDGQFVAIAGYEHSENNGPGGNGHLNVINSATYLNAMAPKIDLPYLYEWLKTAAANGDGPVVASFNHPGPHQYNDWGYRDAQVTDIITMLEVINSNDKLHYEGFINALDKGWKVSPVCGNDNHGLTGIPKHTSRTFVLATDCTKVAILEAMKHRRTYAALDGNIQCTYSVNSAIMGSTLDRPESLEFNISINDPDTGNPKDKITKIDIVKDGGAVVDTYAPAPAHAVEWKTTLHDTTSKYFFIRVWNAGGGDAPKAKAENPVAWLAPVWTGR